MLSESELDPALIAAYRRTEYQVGKAFALRIDEHSEPMREWQRRHGVSCAAFVTAANPRSLALTHHENQARHERLRTRLAREGLRFEEGEGVDPDRRWPPEPAFLIAGLDTSAARRLGREFDQNAVVWCGSDAIPQLLLLR